jgi:E3 ubiquitin-protein ligase RNF14
MAAGLSDDVLLNWQQQADEVQALEAIFASSFQLVDAAGLLCGSSDAGAQCSWPGTSASAFDDAAEVEAGQRSEALDAASLQLIDAPCSSQWELHCSLMAPVEPPAGSLRLLLQDPREQQQQQQDQQGKQQAEHTDKGEQDAASRLTDSGSNSSRADEHARATGGYTVQHLPPICLQLRMTAGYPSEQPPGVRLSAAWLSAAQASALESQLLQQWQEQGPGAPICYSWADWLQTHALMHLGVDQWLLLADDCRPDSGSDDGGSNDRGGTLAAQQQLEQQEQELDGGSGEQRLVALLR